MRVNAYHSADFIVDIAQGDIFDACGDLLLVGRPKGLRAADPHMNDPGAWEPLDNLPRKRAQRYRDTCNKWKHIFSFRYRAGSRGRLPTAPDDWPVHYAMLQFDLRLFVSHVMREQKPAGHFVLGISPLSWRNPRLGAHATAVALADLFGAMRDDRRYGVGSLRDLRSLTVPIRSLDPPDEFREVFDRDYFAEFCTRCGLRSFARGVWCEA